VDKELIRAGERVRQILIDKGKQPMFLTVSGSHSHNLARPDSDIDIRGVYLDPTSQILSLHRGKDTVEGSEGILDYQLYEFGKFLGMLLKGNGNMIRLVLSPTSLWWDQRVDWNSLVQKFITKRLRLYYRGYAESQRKRCMSQRGGKALIYTYREMFEGLSVMRLGFPIFDFKELWQWVVDEGYYGGGLLDKYFPCPTANVSDEGWRKFYSEWEDLCEWLDTVADESYLPHDYDGFEEMNKILYDWRIANIFEEKVKEYGSDS